MHACCSLCCICGTQTTSCCSAVVTSCSTPVLSTLQHDSKLGAANVCWTVLTPKQGSLHSAPVHTQLYTNKHSTCLLHSRWSLAAPQNLVVGPTPHPNAQLPEKQNSCWSNETTNRRARTHTHTIPHHTKSHCTAQTASQHPQSGHQHYGCYGCCCFWLSAPTATACSC